MEDSKEDCFYSILGLQKDCSASDVRCAYRKLAMKWHPDKCSTNESAGADSSKASENAKTRFQAIQEAYSVLSNNNKRLMYDAGVYDDDDNELEMSSFVGEMAAMMSNSAKEIDATDGLDELKAMFLNIISDDFPKPDIGKKRSNNCPREKATNWNSMSFSTCEFKNQGQLRGGFHYESTALGNQNSSAFGGGYALESQELKQMFMGMDDSKFYELACNKEPSDKPLSQKDGKKQCKSGPTTFDELVAETLFPDGGITGSDLFGMGLWSKTESAVCTEASITSAALAEENGAEENEGSKRRKLCPEQKDANRASEELDCTYRWSADICGGEQKAEQNLTVIFLGG
ncbi:chaperone protein dnaJ 15 isoform X1 [Cryptomeria japonica]|uniref:chaperone protein dnaJ 15 isoform X1 n=1 Tax=Cryptomeria japonica TaxID=3369 RepID=UPI0027DAB011|nr:chaperone protein dnaJ 15 isoform X1 [Cryptomeria japonica]